MSKKILANDGIDAAGKALLEKAGFIIVTEKVAQLDLAQAIKREGYVALTVRSATQVRQDLIDACPSLRVIGRGGVGMDNIDVEYAKSKGLAVINTPAASSHSVAELVMAHLFGMVRFLPDANRQMPQSGTAKFEALKKAYSKGKELQGKTIGIVGFGRIGQAVARIALGLGMHVKAYDPFVKEAKISLHISGLASPVDVPVQTVSLDEIYASADFITLHVPGGKLLGAAELSKLKKGVMLVNASRGGVIDELALLDALNSGQVSQCALDVFENEPTPLVDLLKHPSISLTPHIGAATEEAQERIGIELAEKIIAAFNAN
ncbi:MAG: D-2-hydroxyacid dehydrogenase [Bacteroidia bacterium]